MENKKQVNVLSDHKLSNSAFHRSGGKGSGKAHWWIRRNGGEFLDLGARVRGDSYLDIDVEIEPGEYTLGVGAGNDAIRETHTVTDDGEWS